MFRKPVFAAILLIPFATCPVLAQNNLKNLTIEDVVLAAKRGYTPEKLEQLQWIPGTETFSYVSGTNPEGTLVTGGSRTGEPKQIITLSALNKCLVTLHADTLDEFPKISWTDPVNFTFSEPGVIFGVNTTKGSCVRVVDSIPASAANTDWNPVKQATAYTIENNLWVATPAGRNQVTHETNLAIVNGVSVHREEFGITKGTFWSPKGNLLAFYRMDQTMVTDYPVLDLEKTPATATMIKYPMAGGTSHQVTIGVYSMETGKTVFLKTGLPADQYLTNIAWHPDEQSIYVAILNRDQNHLWMKKYSAITGDEQALFFEETDSAYVQPLNPMVWNKAGTRFIWQSRRDGFNHLYLYDNAGKLIKQLTSGTWEVTEFHGFNDKGTLAYFTANREEPINRDLYSVDVSSGKITRLTNGAGVHKSMVCGSGSLAIDEFSGPGIPRDTKLISGSGKPVRTLLSSANPLRKFNPVQIELFKIPNESGTELYCRLIKPANFDSTHKYPAIVYVYGGPNVNLITNNWTGGADLWMRYMAQRGFVIFTLENRGTPNRGKAFEQATFRKLGDAELADQVVGVKYLMKQRFVNPGKMGLYGWSYGGFMTISMMTRNPGLFTTAVAGGPVIDWSMYEVMYTERYMDTPETNPQGYNKSNLLNYVQNLKGNLLIIHGTSDPVVVWQQSLKYLKRAVDTNIQLDYYVYPGHEHNIMGKDRIHLLNKVSEYFFEHLR